MHLYLGLFSDVQLLQKGQFYFGVRGSSLPISLQITLNSTILSNISISIHISLNNMAVSLGIDDITVACVVIGDVAISDSSVCYVTIGYAC